MKIFLMIMISTLLMFFAVGCATKNKSSKMNESLHIPAGNGDLEIVKAEIDGGMNTGHSVRCVMDK